MKLQRHTLIALASIPVAILGLSGCSTEPKGQGAAMLAIQPGEPGGTMVQTYQETATVTGIDSDTRKITLVAPDGSKQTVKAGPEVVNFDQIRIGDQVKATVTEELVVCMRKSGEPSNGQLTTVALAPAGAKPGVMMADTVEVTGKVTAIDELRRKATVQFPDGKSKTFKVRDDIDLSKRTVGEEVVFRSTEAMAVQVEQP